MEIEITTPNHMNGIPNNNVRNLRFTTDEDYDINIVLGIKHSNRVGGDFPRPYGNIPNRLIYGAHIVIVFDFLCSEFTIVKNRMGPDPVWGTIGDVLTSISRGLLSGVMMSQQEINELIVTVIGCITDISGEPILVTYDYPFGVTLRDIKKGEIKSIPPFKHLYKHRFF